MHTPARMLVVGLGRGTSWARQIARMPEAEIAGLVDVDAGRLATVAEELGVASNRCYTDYETALRFAGADVAVLALPTQLHVEMSLQGLRAGHHVICEKPLAMTLDEARRLRDALPSFGHRFMVGEQYRFADGVENLRRAIAAGKTGRLAYVDHEFYRGGSATPGRWANAQHWSRAYQEPALHDMSVHHFDMWYVITGSPCAEISAVPFNPAWNQSPRTFGYSVSATLEDGTHVHYLTARALARPQTTWYGTMAIVGEQGTLQWDGESAEVTVTRARPSENPMDQRLDTERYAEVNSGAAGTNETVPVMLRAFFDAIRENRPHPCDVRDNWPSFATSMAAVESARTGKPVRVARE